MSGHCTSCPTEWVLYCVHILTWMSLSRTYSSTTVKEEHTVGLMFLASTTKLQCSPCREQLATFLQPSGAGVRLASPSLYIWPFIILHQSLFLNPIYPFWVDWLLFVSSISFPLPFNTCLLFSIILPQPPSLTPLALSSNPCPPYLPFPPGCVTSVLTLPSWQQLGMTTRWRKNDKLEEVRAKFGQIDLD